MAIGDAESVVLPIAGSRVTQLRLDHRLSLLFDSGSELAFSGLATLRSSAEPIPVEPARQLNVVAAIDLLWDTVTRAEGHPTGLLTIEFSTGRVLAIDADPEYEAWEFVTIHGELRVVCLPGGGLATWGFDPHRPTGGAIDPDRTSECCFCSAPLHRDEPGSLTFIVTAARRHNDFDDPSQQLWCHSSCLASRLAARVPFDPEAFDD